MNIQTLAEEINRRSAGYSIGGLQELRAELKGLKRVPGSTIFSAKTTFDHWAFHHGGRSELQFNIGSESTTDGEIIRYGLAFSFETSQSLPSIDVLVPKVGLFNEYVLANLDSLSDFEMWHFQNGSRSLNRMPTPISADLAQVGTFVFLGAWSPVSSVDSDDALADFDRLLPLYKFVESGGTVASAPNTFAFRPGNNRKQRRAVGSVAQKALSIDLRHNELQEILFRQLCDEFGSESVGTEIPSGTGGRIDVVSRCGNDFTFYEIKVGHSLQSLVREALGQLLEYSLWPGATQPAALVIAGEPPIDHSGKKYLQSLAESLPISLSYRQIAV